MKRQIPYFIRRRALRGIIFYGLCSLLQNPPWKNTEILVSIRRMLPSLLMRTAVRSMCNILVAVSLTDNGSQLMLVQKVSCIHATLLPKTVRKFCLKFRGCFKCGEVQKTARSASCPTYPLDTSSQELMDTFDKEFKTHIPSTNNSNNPTISAKKTHNVSY